MTPLISLVGRPAARIVENYIKTWRPEAATADSLEDACDVVDLLDPPVVFVMEPDAATVRTLAGLPNGMVVCTEARLGPEGLVAGIRHCFLPISPEGYTHDHMDAANALVIEAHIRRVRKLAGKD